MKWQAEFEHEIAQGLEARARGNEGQARVRARRAAGAAVRAYVRSTGGDGQTLSAFQLLGELLKMPGIPERARQATEYLVLRVNEEFNLPADVDLLQQARILAVELFPQVSHDSESSL